MFGILSSSVIVLTDGNLVIGSPHWNDDMGAATWMNATTGLTGPVSSANSLVGGTNANGVAGFNAVGDYLSEGDQVGANIVALPNGDYVVDTPSWSFNTGAVTWGSGTSGVSGVVSSTNSLVGRCV